MLVFSLIQKYINLCRSTDKALIQSGKSDMMVWVESVPERMAILRVEVGKVSLHMEEKEEGAQRN